MIRLSDKIEHKSRPQFISRSGLLLILISALIVSWFVYPRSLFFERSEGQQVSQLSLSYLKVLLSKSPKNNSVRLRLADQQLRFYQQDKAWQTIEPLVVTDNKAAHYLGLKIRFQQLVNANLVADKGHFMHQSVVLLLSQALSSNFADIHVANIAAALGEHIQAAELYERLAQQNNHNIELLESAALQYLAGQEPKLAANVYYTIYKHSPSIGSLYQWASATLSDKVNKSQLQWYLSEIPKQPNMKYWQLAGQLALAASSPLHYVNAQEKIYALSATKAHRDQLVTAYMGQGQLTKALPLVKQQLSENSDDPAIHRKIRDLYLWIGMPNLYLKEVRWLVQHSPRADEIEQAAPLAIGQFRFTEATWLYENLSKFRILSSAELTNWFESHYQAGTPEKGAAALRKYMDNYGPNAQLVALLARVANDLGDYQQLLRDWTDYGRHFQLPPSIYQLYSGANWQQGDFSQALKVLNRVPIDDRSIEYWKLYGDLAWLGDQAEVAIEAYQQHLALDSQAEGQTIARLEVLLARYRPEDYFNLLLEHFKQHGIPRYLLLASDILIERGDVEQLDTLLKIGEEKGTFDQLPILRTYQSWLFQKQGKQLASLNSLQKGYAALPHNQDIQLALLWGLLAHGDEQALHQLVNNLAHTVVNQSAFWQPMALSYERLKMRKKAIPWYQKVLHDQPENYEIMFNYAEALKATGYISKSYQLKQHLMAKLSNHISEFGKVPAFLQLVLWNQFDGISASLRQEILYEPGNENLLLSYLVQANQLHAAQSHYKRYRESRVNIHDSISLRLALARRDKAQIERLLATGLNLPPADRVSALIMLNRDREAIRWAEENLSAALTNDEQSQLTRRLVSIKPKYPHYVNLRLNNSTAYQQQDIKLSYGMPFGDSQHWKTAIVSENYDDIVLPSGTKLALTGQTKQISWINHWQWKENNDDFTLTTDLAWGDGWRRDGLALSWQRSWLESLSTKAYWQINQATKASQLAAALAQSDELGLSVNWQVTTRESVALDLKTVDYDSHFGDSIGKGTNITLTLTERLFRNDPAWQVYMGWQWQRNDLAEGTLVGVAQTYNEANVSSSDFLTPIYGRFSVGSRVYRGQPGEVGRASTSPRFFVDANIGYEYFTERIDYGLSSGVGWRIFGADELSVSMQYQSSNLQQNSDFKVTLNYQFHFD